MELAAHGWVFDALTWGERASTPVLLLHGFPEGSRCWSSVGPLLAERGLHAVAPDQRGYSPGARPDETEDYSLDSLVADAVGLLDALGWDSAHVAGHDWGSVVAWTLSARHPDRVRTLTAVSVPHPAVFARAVASDADQQRRSAYLRTFRTPGVAESALAADDGAALRRVYAGSGLSADEIEQLVRPLLAPGALTAALSWYRATPPATMVAIPATSVPTTFVWGEDDVAVGRTAADSAAQGALGDYRFVPLPAVGHWVPEQCPATLAELIVARASSADRY